MKAWHFVEDTLRDGRPVPPDGEWLVHPGYLFMCESGYHASKRIIDAFHYAPGNANTICRVEVDGKIIEDSDKLVAEKRKILWRVNGDKLLRAFARWCALQAVRLWDAPDAVIKYLETGNDVDGSLWYLADEVTNSEDYKSRYVVNHARRAALWASVPEAWNKAYCMAYMAAGHSAHAINFINEKEDIKVDAIKAQNKQLEQMVKEARTGKDEWTFNIQKEQL